MSRMERAHSLNVSQRIRACGLIPIIRFHHIDQAEKIAEALLAARVDIIEFSMTSRQALLAIEKVTGIFGDTIVAGAGTVLDVETARACILAGARFIISPAIKPDVISMCKRYSAVACPGALTPTEVLLAWESGADFVKIFPCGNVGGVQYIRSLKAPYPHIEMIPVGGVTTDNAADYIHAGCAALGVGAGIISGKSLEQSHYEDITEKASRLFEIIQKAKSTSRE
jgi:2-dehydro-3-deoxyphosphogluconate aldolase/(4S)-4-hydroxy-2-oxoglutarate aldolase